MMLFDIFTEEWKYLVAIGLLLIGSSFFSSSETAMMAVNRYRLSHLMRLKVGWAHKVHQLLSHPDRLLTTILVSNNITNIVAASLVTLVAAKHYSQMGIFIATLLLTFIVVLFAEIIPKSIAATWPEKSVRVLVYPLWGIYKIIYPVTIAISSVASIFIPRKKADMSSSLALSTRELMSVIKEAKELIDVRHLNVLLSVLDIEDTKVEDVMIPIDQAFAIDISQPIEEIKRKCLQSQYTRIPVYDKEWTNVLGVINLRKLLNLSLSKSDFSKQEFKSNISKARFCPANVDILDQMTIFVTERFNMSVVADEYGDVVGITTLEDLALKILGVVTSFSEDKSIKKISPKNCVANGQVLIADINRFMDWHIPESSNARTISGIMVEHLNDIPTEQVTVQISRYLFEAIAMDEKTITQVQVKEIDS